MWTYSLLIKKSVSRLQYHTCTRKKFRQDQYSARETCPQVHNFNLQWRPDAASRGAAPTRPQESKSGPGNEGHDAVHEQLGVLALGLREEEDVLLSFGLEPRHVPGPRAGRHGFIVRAVPHVERVLLPGAHQHPRAPEPLQRRRARRERVHPRVVGAADRARARVGPEPSGGRCGTLRLALDGRVPAEPRVEQDGALDARPAGAGRPHQHVVHDVCAGAVAGEEEPRRVAVLDDPLVLRRRHPLERGPRVLVGRRDRVLRCQAVVHGHHQDARGGCEWVDVGVVRGRAGRLEEERAAVEVDEDRELLGWFLELGEVDAYGKAGAGVQDDVL
uniref:Uncharacterized protein n=1 Tax=Zea mays TaxID=4577 RepID=C4J3L8_MAIZE|nr:unknown [Zea mays]